MRFQMKKARGLAYTLGILLGGICSFAGEGGGRQGKVVRLAKWPFGRGGIVVWSVPERS